MFTKSLLLSSVFIAGSFAAISAALAAGPGTDTFGNSITSSDYDPTIPTGIFMDISGTGTVLVIGDDVASGPINLGFAFPFYGTNYTSLNFATNGYISTDPTDGGPDLSNDPSLPSTPSTGGGGRIYPYHDDIVTTIYGQYFNSGQSIWGTEMYVAQWDGRHFGGPASELNFNTFLLRDGTIIFAYDLVSPEAGSGATVGIQDPTFTDGVAYSANEAVLSPGLTVLITPPGVAGPFAGIGSDLNITASTMGSVQTREQASAIGSAVATAFSKAEGEFISTAAVSRQSGAGETGISAWAAVQGTAINGNLGSSVSGSNYALRAGFDRMYATDFIGGVAFSYAHGRLGIGTMRTTGNFYTVEPYIAARFASNWTATASVSYTRAEYDRISTPMITASASGDRFAGSLGLEGRFYLPDADLTLVPSLTITGGTEKISNWKTATISNPTPSTSFFTAEATLKAEKQIELQGGTKGKAYVLAGLDFTNANGDSTIALYATNFRKNQVGGVAAAGFELVFSNDVRLRSEVKGTGIGSNVSTISASTMIKKSF